MMGLRGRGVDLSKAWIGSSEAEGDHSRAAQRRADGCCTNVPRQIAESTSIAQNT